MMNLIGLELRKNNLKPYLYGALGIFVFALLTGVLFSALPFLEPNNPTSAMFKDEAMIIIMIGIVSMSAFAVLAAVMYAKFVVEEYTGCINVLLFTYPQKRSRILFAKFMIVSSFVFLTMFSSTVICSLLVGFIGRVAGILSQPFTDIFFIFKINFLFAMVSNFIGMIALRAGFYKKSIIIPVVTAMALASPFGNLVALLGEKSIIAILLTTILFCFISFLLFWGLLKKANRMECL